MKKKLLLMLTFSLIAHITVAGTLIYMPYQLHKDNKAGHSDNIIWSTVQSETAGSSKQAGDGKEKAEVRGKKLEGGSKKRGVIARKAKQSKNEIALGPKSLTLTDSKKSEVREIAEERSEIRSQKLDVTDDKVEVAAGLSLRPLEEVNSGQFGGDAGCSKSITCGGGESSGVYSSMDKTGSGVEGGRGDSLKAFLQQVRVEIERRKYYPVFARTNRIEGTVYINLHISSDGKPEGIFLERSSGSKILDESAIDTLKSIKQFSSLPDEIGELDVTVPIAYRLVNNQ